MNRIDRLFGITTLLQSKKYISANQISEHFNISVRTVYRDLKTMQEQGIPICFEPNKGYSFVQGYFLSPISFSMDEANALILVENLVLGFADKSIKTNYSTALTKVKSVLKTVQKEKLDQLNQHIKLQLPNRLTYDFEHLSFLQNAISEKTQIEINYKNVKEELSNRQIDPIGVIFYAFGWHLIAWCHLRNDYRDFNLSRIISIKNLNSVFLKQDHISLAEYMKQLPVDY